MYRTNLGKPALAILFSAATAALMVVSSAGAAESATTTITLKEPTKGSTVTFIDNAPTAKKVHGFPTKISPGDEVVLSNQLFQNGVMVGKLRSRCTATDPSGGSGEAVFINAHFICEGVYNIKGSSLYANGQVLQGGTQGVITGGTGSFANARGTFVTKVEKGGETSTITLVE
jgi:hypothetical protein